MGFCAFTTSLSVRGISATKAKRNVCIVSMRSGKRKSGEKKNGEYNAISRLPPEEQAKFDQVAEKYGIKVPKEGSDLDRQYTSPSKESDEPKGKTFYILLAEIFGTSTLDTVESATYVVLGCLLIAFIGTGLAIASEAFFMASKAQIPPVLDSIALAGEKYFTPMLFLFLILSSILGLYKQSQLNSGVAQYDESDSSGPR